MAERTICGFKRIEMKGFARAGAANREELMEIADARLLLMELLAMTKTRKGKQNIKTTVALQKCCQCECVAKQGKRGLCGPHYNRFEYDRELAAGNLKGNKRQKAKDAFDQAEVDAGRILPARRGRRKKQLPTKAEARTA